MLLTFDSALLIGSILVFVALVVGKTSYKFGVPALLLFLCTGVLAGVEGIGGIYFANPGIAHAIGILALCFILFSGGFETDWKTIHPIVWHGLSLSTLGVIITTGLCGVFIYTVTDFTLYEALLVGAIVSALDPAAVFWVLRSKNLALKGRLRPTLELESGCSNTIAYALTVVFTTLGANQNATPASMFSFFFRDLVIGAVFGFAIGYLGARMFNKIKLDFEGMYPVLMTAIMVFSYAAASFSEGNGFLSVYLTAVILGNQDLIHKRQILRWFDGAAWIMQVTLFVTLGILITPSRLIPVAGIGLGLALFMIIIARPAAVFLSMLLVKRKRRGKTLIAWVGLRGAAPIVFATYPLLAGLEKARMIFYIVFFVALVSVALQETTIHWVAARLRLLLPVHVKRLTQADMELADTVKSELVEIYLSPASSAVGKQIVELGFPPTAMISLIKRNGTFISPGGATVLAAGDTLSVISDNKNSLRQVYAALEIKQPTE